MKSVSGKALCKLLEQKGWELRSIHGSHHVFLKTGRRERISIPVHGNNDLKLGLLKAIMKIAEIDESEL